MPNREDKDVPIRNNRTFISIYNIVEGSARDARTNVPSSNDDKFSREVE